MKYFYNISNLQELKKAYRENVVRFHPDRNGGTTTAQFQEMQNEYEKAQRIISEGGKIGPQTTDADTSAQSARYSRTSHARHQHSSSRSSQHQTKTAEQRERERKEREAQWRAARNEAEAKAQTEFEAKDRCMKEAAKSDKDCLKWAKILKPIHQFLKYDGKDSAKQKANIRANVQRMARHFYSGVQFSFSGSGWSPRLSWEDGPSVWEVEKHRDDFDLFRGRTWHAAGVSDDYGHSEPRKGGEIFRYMYGSIDDGLRFERKFSEDTKRKVKYIIRRMFTQFLDKDEATFTLSDLDILYNYMQMNEEKVKFSNGSYLVDRCIHIDTIVRFFAKFWTYDIESDYMRATSDTEENKKAQAFAEAFAEAMDTAKHTAEAFAEAIKKNNKKENNTQNSTNNMKKNNNSFFSNVTNIADLTAQFQNLALQFITEPEKLNAIRLEYLKIKEQLNNANGNDNPNGNANANDSQNTQKVAEPWLKIIDYSEKSFVVTGFGEPEDMDKGHQYKYIERYFLARFEKVAGKRCSVNVNLRDGLRGIVISKKVQADVEKLVAKLNKKERPQYDPEYKSEKKSA